MSLLASAGSKYSLYRAMTPRGVAGGAQVISTSGELVTRTMTWRGGEGPGLCVCTCVCVCVCVWCVCVCTQ